MSVGMSQAPPRSSPALSPSANADPAKNPQLTIVDAAQGGRTANDWASPDRMQTWQEATRRLTAAGRHLRSRSRSSG